MGFQAARERLRRMAREEIFQPKAPAVPIQVMGILESAGQKLVLRDSLSDFLMRLPALVTRKRQAVAVLRDYLQVSEIVRMLAVFDFRHLCVQFAERIRLSCQTLGFGRQNCRAIPHLVMTFW